MTTPNGNGFTTKDVLVRVEGKLDGFIASQTTVNERVSKSVEDLRLEFVKHEMLPGHPPTTSRLDVMDRRVVDVEKEELTRNARVEGRNDVLRLIFGTSIAALVTGLGGLILGILKFMEGK